MRDPRPLVVECKQCGTEGTAGSHRHKETARILGTAGWCTFMLSNGGRVRFCPKCSEGPVKFLWENYVVGRSK